MGNFNYKTIARLKPGVSVAQASAELEALQRAYSLTVHLPFRFGISLTPLTKDVVCPAISGALWLFVCGGRLCIADCLRKSRQSAVGSRRECTAGNGGARSVGRESDPTGPVAPRWRLCCWALLGAPPEPGFRCLWESGCSFSWRPPVFRAWTKCTSTRPLFCLPRGFRFSPRLLSEFFRRCGHFVFDPQAALQGNSSSTVSSLVKERALAQRHGGFAGGMHPGSAPDHISCGAQFHAIDAPTARLRFQPCRRGTGGPVYACI